MEDTVQYSRFSWIWHNEFFATTTLTGFGFINDSRKLTEVFFWYALLGVFAIFTINNVASAFIYYQSLPTKSELTISSNASAASLKNFTISLTLPQSELAFGTTISAWTPLGDAIYYPCNPDSLMNLLGESLRHFDKTLAQEDMKNFHDKYGTITGDKYGHYDKFGKPKTKQPENEDWFFGNMKNSQVFSSKSLLADLRRKYSNLLKKSWKEQKIHLFSNLMVNISNEGSLDLWSENFLEHFNAVPHEPHAYEYNFLLDTMLRETKQDRYNVTKDLNMETIFEMKQSSPDDFFESTSKKVFNIAPMMVHKTDGSNVQNFLRNWKLDADQEKIGGGEIGNVNFRMADTQTIETQVLVAEGTDELIIEIELPKQFLKYLFLMKTLHEFADEDAARNDLFRRDFDPNAWIITGEMPMSFKMLDCGKNSHLDPKKPGDEVKLATLSDAYLQSEFDERFINPVLEYYAKNSLLHIQTESGSVKLEPFNSYQIKMLPTGRILSLVKNCTTSSLAYCLDSCQSEFSLSHCSCYEWPMHYMYSGDSGKTICSKPCAGSTQNKGRCFLHCERMLAHPCDYILYRPEVTQKIPIVVNRLSRDEHLFRVHISIEKVFNYIKTTEAYEMEFGNLMAQIGGLMEFWLGINVMGLTHLLIFLLKQCFGYGRKKTDAERKTSVWNGNKNSVSQTENRILLLEQRLNAEIKQLKQQQMLYDAKLNVIQAKQKY